MSMLSTAERRSTSRLTLWSINLLNVGCAVLLSAAALNDASSSRLYALAAAATTAALLLPSVLQRPELRAIASDAAGSSVMSDLILLAASCMVWRGQTPYEDMALSWFRVVGFWAALLGCLGGTAVLMWLSVKPTILQLFITVPQLAGGASQLLLASLLFPHAPREQFAYTVPLFLLTGFVTQLFWGLVVKPPASSLSPPATQRQPAAVPAASAAPSRTTALK